MDAHAQASGLASSADLHEVHGNIETWCCYRQCGKPAWVVPPEFRFEVDPETMLANVGLPKIPVTTPGWKTNHPTCPSCGGPARPAILMFMDDGSYQFPSAYRRWAVWKGAAISYLKANPGTRSMVILEIGCGTRVPTIRFMTEDILHLTGPNSCTLVRVNPDPVECGFSETTEGGLSLRDKALPALSRIDKELTEIDVSTASQKLAQVKVH